MKPIWIYFAIGALLMPRIACCSQPLDRRATSILLMTREVLEREDTKQFSEAEAASVLEAAESDHSQAGPPVRMAAAYALGFIDSERSQELLSRLAKCNEASVAGVAQVSLLRKQVSHLQAEQRLAVLSFTLARSEERWARTLLVSWLGDEFKGKVVPLFLRALQSEEDALVRAELYFQVASYGNPDQLAEVKSVLKQEEKEPTQRFAAGVGAFLNLVSENPIKRFYVPGFLERMIDSVLE